MSVYFNSHSHCPPHHFLETQKTKPCLTSPTRTNSKLLSEPRQFTFPIFPIDKTNQKLSPLLSSLEQNLVLNSSSIEIGISTGLW